MIDARLMSTGGARQGLGPLAGDVAGKKKKSVVGGAHEASPGEASCVETVLSPPAVRERLPGKPIHVAEQLFLLHGD
jgi:hypothetical protein